jgi:endonuclease YncB( thermonuclease family)
MAYVSSGLPADFLRTLLLIHIKPRHQPMRFGRVVAGLLFALVLPGLSAAAERYLPGRVVHVSDGDSLVLEVGGARYRIDLAGIDAPETNQPWGGRAKQSLAQLVGAFVVAEIPHGSETSPLQARLVYKQRDIALDLVYDGLAWSLMEQRPEGAADHPYSSAEKDARAQRRGLWSDPRAIPPWNWRLQRGPQPSHAGPS